ncbi:MFS transporter [Photobacterium galatheae]|uniref:MFS transporter n=1 Tax=Photobacterium galatheae TaxID=1654360 RepID=UPI00202CD2B0|nr:MFS transporter [Photobacterium galatheae]MCM0148591.1 MFS transporter [Photobacterium galatheae]
MSQKGLTSRFGIQQCLHWTIAGIMIPVLMLIFQSRGLSLMDIGIVMAVWIGSTALFEIPLGGVADTYGRRKTYLTSLLINILGCIVLYFADGLPLILLAAILLGTSRAVYSGTLDAWFYDSFQHQPGHQSFHSASATINVFVTLGLAVGSLIGGWLPDFTARSFPPSSTFSAQSIYDLNIALVVIASIVLMLITRVLIHEEGQPAPSPANQLQTDAMQASWEAVKTAFRHAVLNRLMQTTLVFGMILSGIENYWQPYLGQLINGTDYGVTFFGILSALYFLMSAGSSILSVRLLRQLKGSHKILMFSTRVAAGIAFIALANTTQPISFALCYLLFFFLFTAGNNSERVLLHEHTETRVRSTMLSISSFMVTCGGVLASLFFGLISENYGISVSWTIGGLLLVASSVLFLFMPKKLEVEVA